jgi:hypothetical protein
MMVRYPQGRNLTDRQGLWKSATRPGTVLEGAKMRSKVVAVGGSVGRTVGGIDGMRGATNPNNKLRGNVGRSVKIPEAGKLRSWSFVQNGRPSRTFVLGVSLEHVGVNGVVWEGTWMEGILDAALQGCACGLQHKEGGGR